VLKQENRAEGRATIEALLNYPNVLDPKKLICPSALDGHLSINQQDVQPTQVKA
jgi:hypothetical protein